MKKPQLTNKKGTMQKQKKYQYLYLKEKINHRYTDNEYSNLNTEYWDSLGTGLSDETLKLSQIDQLEKENRTMHLRLWLNKINKKYNYIN